MKLLATNAYKSTEEGKQAADTGPSLELDEIKAVNSSSSYGMFNPYTYTVLNNETAKHAIPVAINMMNNAILDSLLEEKGDVRRGILSVSFSPFPVVPTEEKVSANVFVFAAFLIARV